MTEGRLERRLSAILAADVAGYSRMMGVDEEGTHRRLTEHRRALVDPAIAAHHGRIVKNIGDGLLAEFASVVDALRSAVEIQRGMEERNAELPAERRIEFRIGLNVGDVIIEQDDILGEGVNIAARLQAMAQPGGICVAARVQEDARGKLDIGFADAGEVRLKNIAWPVRVYHVALDGSPAEAPPAPALPDQPAIVVLPFANLSDHPNYAFVADGVTEDLTTALSRLRWLFVIAPNSASVYKQKAVDTGKVARELGVGYVLEGSVRTAGQRIRITAQLIDAEGKHVWAEKYDRDLSDIFAVQDEIIECIVAAIEPQIYAREGFRAATRPPESIGAWGRVVRAIDLINRFGRKENEKAQRLLRRAIEADPEYARAHATLSWAIWWATLYHYAEDRAAGFAESTRHAEAALRLDQNEPWAHMMVGLNLSTAGQHQRGLAEMEAALQLNPSFALGHTTYGWTLLRAGRFEEAVAETAKAMRMSPMDSFAGLYTTTHGLALLGMRRFAEALPHLRASVAAGAEFAGHYNVLISCCGHLGLADEAAEFIARRNQVGPPLHAGIVRYNLRAFAHRDVFVEGLLKAGVPE